MAHIHASWVHGSSVQPQRQGFFVNSIREGYGALFRSHNQPGKGGEWFHFAIPTPVIVSSTRVLAVKVLIRYATIQTAKITAVHLYDVETRFKSFDGLSLASAADATVEWVLAPGHQMRWGLGISVFVDFGASTAQGVPGIRFRAAGADFQVP